VCGVHARIPVFGGVLSFMNRPIRPPQADMLWCTSVSACVWPCLDACIPATAHHTRLLLSCTHACMLVGADTLAPGALVSVHHDVACITMSRASRCRVHHDVACITMSRASRCRVLVRLRLCFSINSSSSHACAEASCFGHSLHAWIKHVCKWT
jgi:hypothetical protein